MVKRKWLWGKRSSEKMGGETESSGSLSSQSEKYSEDQDASKGSPNDSQSPEITSKETDNENSGEEMNESLESLAQKLSDTPIDDGSLDSLSQEDEPNVCVDECTQKLSDSFIDDQSADSLSKENITEVSMDKDSEPEKVAKTSNDCKEDNNSVKLLTEKLSAALLNVSLKDDLVKQHAKVAEEAVAGWEKAEKEVTTVRQQLETAIQQKSTVEARANHLDEALKECVRQLRLARDEQERKIKQAVTEKTNELELVKAKFEDQLAELQALVDTSRASSPDPELLHRLETLERENVVLRKELQAQSEELEIRTIERDLSTKAAETASKQHLESIKKIAKLEAECRKLKSVSRVSSIAGVSSYAESLTESHSDSGEQPTPSEAESSKINGSGNPSCSESWASALIAELDQFKTEKVGDRGMQHNPSPPIEIDLMDDFLEMERLAALPMHDNGHRGVEKPVNEKESKLRVELESVINRTAELEEKIEKVEAEKDELTMALVQTQSCLETSQVQLIETQMKFEQLEKELWGANEGHEFYRAKAISLEKEAQLMCSKIDSLREEVDKERALSVASSARCGELENELDKKNEELAIRQDAICNGELRMKEVALVETQDSLEKSKGQLREAETKLGELERQLNASNEEKDSLRSRLDRERAMLVEKSARCEELENDLEKKKKELEIQKDAICNGELKMKEMALAEARECLEKSKGQLREMETKLGELERELNASNEETESLKSQLDRERALSVANSSRCEELENELERKKKEIEIQQDAICNGELKMKEMELTETRERLEKSQGQLGEAQTKLGELERELDLANEEKKSLGSQLDNVRTEVQAMSSQIDSLKEQVCKERALAAEFSTKCMELENALQQKANAHNELKVKQEDVEAAAGKLADCQKTIASLGTQLKSLATLEDFLIDTASIPGFSPPAPLMARRSTEPWKLHANHTFLPEKEYGPHEGHGPFMRENHNGRHTRESYPQASSSSSSTSTAYFMNPPGCEKSANGFAKYFSLSRN